MWTSENDLMYPPKFFLSQLSPFKCVYIGFTGSFAYTSIVLIILYVNFFTYLLLFFQYLVTFLLTETICLYQGNYRPWDNVWERYLINGAKYLNSAIVESGFKKIYEAISIVGRFSLKKIRMLDINLS